MRPWHVLEQQQTVRRPVPLGAPGPQICGVASPVHATLEVAGLETPHLTIEHKIVDLGRVTTRVPRRSDRRVEEEKILPRRDPLD